MTPDRFVRRLAQYSSECVFNPYADVCPVFDRYDAAKIKRSNLRLMIDAALSGGADTIWIARDLGYRGGRRTGLALTDEAHLIEAGAMLGLPPFKRATKGPAMTERTATIIWHMLSCVGEPVMLWNVFPFHPYELGDPMSNRRHTSAERNATQGFLLDLLDLIAPSKLVAIGRDAAFALENLGAPVVQARHPSYGGQTEFVRQIEALYQLKPERPA